MYVKLRTQRSSPSRLNGVAPKNRIGTSLVRKKWRTSEMFFNLRRVCPEPDAKAASVPTLTSIGLADGDVSVAGVVAPDFRPTAFLRGRLAGASAVAVARAAAAIREAAAFAAAVLVGRVACLAGAAFFAVFFATFLAADLVARADRTGRSLMVCTSLLVWRCLTL